MRAGRELLDAGLVATVNSDDPAYFGGYVNENYLAAFDALPLDADHARQLAKNSFAAAFLEPAQKQSLKTIVTAASSSPAMLRSALEQVRAVLR